jgi:hypothetical protein
MTNCNAVCRRPEVPSWTARGKPVKLRTLHAPVAQLDRVLPSEGRGRTFESSRACHEFNGLGHAGMAYLMSVRNPDGIRSSEPTKNLPHDRGTGHHWLAVGSPPTALPRFAVTTARLALARSGWGLQAPWWIWIAPAGDKPDHKKYDYPNSEATFIMCLTYPLAACCRLKGPHLRVWPFAVWRLNAHLGLH